MQSAAREHSRAIAQETDQLRKQLNEKESGIKRRSKQLNEIVAQTEMERRMLENDRKRPMISTRGCGNDEGDNIDTGQPRQHGAATPRS